MIFFGIFVVFVRVRCTLLQILLAVDKFGGLLIVPVFGVLFNGCLLFIVSLIFLIVLFAFMLFVLMIVVLLMLLVIFFILWLDKSAHAFAACCRLLQHSKLTGELLV